MKTIPKIIVILGPTASGKTRLGLDLAKKFNGEIISADSRQVYKYMDIGTDKPSGVESPKAHKVESQCDCNYYVEGVLHHEMDIIEPDINFSLVDFKKHAENCIKDIIDRGKLPFVVGGTGLYIDALVNNFDLPGGKPNKKLRVKLESSSLEELQKKLKKLDKASYNTIDINNKRRMIRALEYVLETGKSFVENQSTKKQKYNALKIGIKLDRVELYEKINSRVDNQYKRGLFQEVKKLIKMGYDWGLPAMSGIGYKQMGYFLRGEKEEGEAFEILKRDTRRYAKKQLTWFKRDEKIKWVKDKTEASNLIKKYVF